MLHPSCFFHEVTAVISKHVLNSLYVLTHYDDDTCPSLSLVNKKANNGLELGHTHSDEDWQNVRMDAVYSSRLISMTLRNDEMRRPSGVPSKVNKSVD